MAEPQRSEKWLARRQEIVDRSAQLIAERGYHATGTADLCALNGLGKGALYYYIGSKDELLVAIHDQVTDEVLAGAERALAAGDTPTDQLRALGVELLEVIDRYPHHVRVFLHEYAALTGEPAASLAERRAQYERHVEAVIEAGIAAREFRRDLDPRLTARAWLGMHNYTYLWLKSGGPLSAAEVADRFADIFVPGISK